MTVLGQPSVVYGWDDADRLQSVTQGAAVVLLGYDNANRRTTVTFPNGILATSGYDARDLTGITFTKGAATLGTLTYTTDADGRRTLVGGTWARTTLPPALTSATYNANNQQVQVGPTVLTYDLNGNLATDGAATYTWDARDRLAATSAGSATFQYDPLGRRTRKIVSATTRRFHYDGVNPVQELDGTGGILANLLTGLGIDEYFTRSDSTGTRTLLGDALNSTLALANNAGTVRTTYTYEPFGTASATGQSNTNPYQYTGRENDGTGLDDYRARYYSPSRQRFISEDPIGFAGSDPSLYVYARNNPLSYLDPLGLKVIWNGYPVGSQDLKDKLEEFSNRLCRDISVTGGDRDQKRNTEVAGDPNSLHLTGTAVDFRVIAMSDSEAAGQAARSGLFHGIGYYPSGSPLGPHVHVDLRPTGSTARWRHAREGRLWIDRPWHDSDNVFETTPSFRPLGGRKNGCDLQQGD
jgi:RHS repeat-associated protein